MKRLFIFLFIVCFAGGMQAKDVLQASDKQTPRWVKYTPKSENPFVVYRVVQVYVDNLSQMHEESLKQLAGYLPQEWQVDRFAEWQATGNGSNAIKVRMEGKPQSVQMQCKEVDSYWEVPQYSYSGKRYRCYVLYQVVRPQHTAEEYTRVTSKYGFGPVALSIIPGAGQMYKGSYLKGGLIMGGAVLCAGGIVLCEATKASYKSLASSTHDAKQIKTYTNNANNWATGSYICMGALGALWLYNIIDAAVAPGARRVVVDKKYKGNGTISMRLAPTMFDAYTPGLTAQVAF